MSTGPSPMRDERRIVTALFADIVGSTSLTESLDPEDARDVVGGAVSLVIEQVDALGGTVKDLAGDGVLALFGAPVAHEDDAERAVLCGLRIVDAVADHASDVAERLGVPTISVRVGIETGRAVMGAVGGGSRIEYGATGDVMNTAARLQSLADPGTVLVGAATRAMAGGTFTWGTPQVHELKGKNVPVEAAPAESYTPHRVATSITAASLVGRDDVMQGLAAAVDRLATGVGSVVALVGPAGVGKTRLTQEARSLFNQLPEGTWAEVGAASYDSDIPYLAYRNLFLNWLGLPVSARRDEVRTAVAARAGTLSEAQSAALSALPSMTSAARDDDPVATQERVFRGVRDLVASFADDAPAALVLEDLHWSDPTSLAVTEGLVDLTADRPLLVLVTTRPEPALEAALARIDEATGGRLVRLDVGPLEPGAGRELLAQLTGGTALPRGLADRLLATMEGNPYFCHEQVRALITSGVLQREGGGLRFTGDDDLVLAPTVERALVAQIDRLGEQERQVLLAASVLGPRFAPALLAEVVGADCAPELAELEAADFLVPIDGDGVASDAPLRFRHALLQEAAYASLLKRQRRLLHGRAAGALEREYAGREDEVAAALGHHLARAGETSRAVDYLRVAASSSLASYANDEAASLARAALSLLDEVDGYADDSRIAELLEIEGIAARAGAHYDESAAAYRRLLGLLPQADSLQRARLRCVIAEVLQLAHQYQEALGELEVAKEEVGDPRTGPETFAVWLDVQGGLGEVYYWLADHDRFSALLDEARPVVDEYGDLEQQRRYYGLVRSALWRKSTWVISDEMMELDTALFEAEVQDEDESTRAWAHFGHGFTLLWHRDLPESAAHLRAALETSERLGEVLLRARALAYLLVCARLEGDHATAAAMLPTVLDAADEGDLPEYEAIALATSSWVALAAGDLARTAAEATAALAGWESLPNRYAFDWMACLPLLAVAVEQHNVGAAAASARPMLEEGQQPLPAAVASALVDGLAASEADEERAVASFAAALEAARHEHYL